MPKIKNVSISLIGSGDSIICAPLSFRPLLVPSYAAHEVFHKPEDQSSRSPATLNSEGLTSKLYIC